nr:MAG: ORF1 [TTV-like mini virus]
MPWRYRYSWNRRRPRYRFWRRPRNYFRRRRWRRRRNWVRRRFRKRKLRKLILKQYQPKTIKRCKVKGLCCLYQCNAEKLNFNFQLYENSIVPEHLPGGGGFSLKTFSLNSLYDDHQHCRNFWTHGNQDLPLVRYLGCTFKLYQSFDSDYVFTYQNNFPMVATVDTYCGTQPSMLMMTKHSKIVPSKLSEKRKKPYIKVRARPPSQLQNKWYFMADICNTPLILTQCAACSLDNYYISTQNTSTNINIITLKTGLFENTNFKNTETSGYYLKIINRTEKVYLYATQETAPVNNLKAKDMIFLGNSKDFVAGTNYTTAKQKELVKSWDEWKTNNIKYWGNPLHSDYIYGDVRIFTSTQTSSTLFNNESNTFSGTEIETLVETLRYSPNRDTGEHNSIYFKPITKDEDHWNPPLKEELINTGYPLWILAWGFSDFQKRLGKLQHLETEHCIVIKTDTTFPIRSPIVPLSFSFTQGWSPFEREHNHLDDNRWWPSLQYQYEQLNNICSCGPGVAKLNGKKTLEAKCLYTFYFKFGGSPPPMSWVDDPATQRVYPVPNNNTKTTSLQSPETPIEHFLYNFDAKRFELTKAATERFQKDYSTKRSLLTDGTTSTPFTTEVSTKTQEETTEEEKETQILQLFQQQQQLQQQLKRRINKLMHHLQNLE